MRLSVDVNRFAEYHVPKQVVGQLTPRRIFRISCLVGTVLSQITTTKHAGIQDKGKDLEVDLVRQIPERRKPSKVKLQQLCPEYPHTFFPST